MTSVKIICPGYLRKEDGVVQEAHSTATLVTAPDALVVVDTSSRRYRDRLLDGLSELGVRPEEVDIVVITHTHHDHIGNVDLFTRATKLARAEERPPAGFRAVEEEMELVPGVRLIHTPGHTEGSMSVVVRADDAVYAIAGDALPTRDNHDRWVPPGLHYDADLALASMGRIARAADIIVPGHGEPFPPRHR